MQVMLVHALNKDQYCKNTGQFKTVCKDHILNCQNQKGDVALQNISILAKKGTLLSSL